MRLSVVILIAVALTVASAVAAERDPLGYERLLLPISLGGARPGAFGSLWMSEQVIRNDSDRPAQIFQFECAFFCECVAVTCTTVEVPPGGNYRAPGTFDSFNLAGPGVFMYIGRSAGRLPAQLRIRDISREAGSWGTEVPIVRDEDLLTGAATLLDIPVSLAFRVHLRAYGVTFQTSEASVRVSVLDQQTGQLLAGRSIRLNPGGFVVQEIPFEGKRPSHPAYGEISNLASILPPVFAGERVIVRVEPEVPGLKYWVFVAVTHNETQRVTLITPQ